MSAARFVILLAHGSSDARWLEPFFSLRDSIAEKEPAVGLAFMELAEPSLRTVIENAQSSGYQHFSVLPLFFAAGRHLRKDVPAQLRQLESDLQVHISLLPPIGEHPLLVDAIVRITQATIREHQAAASKTSSADS